MKLKQCLIVSLLALGMLWSCTINEVDERAEIEDAILALIAADDSTYGIDGMEDVDETDLSLGKLPVIQQSGSSDRVNVVMDSSYIWRFGRSGMSSEREVTVEVEDDSSAIALITQQITGTFHARQFVRVWIDERSWERGDSVRFSEKDIDMSVNRRVAFRKRMLPNGDERWVAIAMTLAYGTSGDALDILSLEWVAEDSTRVLSDFDQVFYGRGNPLAFAMFGANQIDVIVSNDVADEAEAVIGRLGFHPRLNGPDLRNRIHFQYVETLESGDKVYSRSIPPVHRPLRHFKGFVEVLDYRTLFDHDHVDYTAATVGFVYTMRRHIRPS
ncbi:MAG: hypothetical protein U9Q77_05835 [Candidatus Marinimicrobia bacterium]|nr:hypothetical protein [Candidatus Neomarinimicrobiota bacterium]